MAYGTARHDMPFGAQVMADGRVRFRLWAPAARKVSIRLQDEGTTASLELPMQSSPGGWYSLVTADARDGTRYRFIIDDATPVPDPASRFQPDDVHGASQVVDPAAWPWQDPHWRGRPWHDAVVYELHVGTFSRAGTFAGVLDHLDYLADLGVTAIELMPVADFPGQRNWGYDGVYLFAPDSRYGRPEDFKALVDAAHARGLMVLLDVVYNHFGPEGNYLHRYAPLFFTSDADTPWGEAIDFAGPARAAVRAFMVHNALYWLEEYRLDGLRLDAVHSIHDPSHPDIITEIARAVRRRFKGRRQVHLILENDRNQASYLARDARGETLLYDAQWNDDLHHVLHFLLTGERDGYYRDYATDPVDQLGRCLTQGFAYQGQASAFRFGQPRGEPSGHLPPDAFVGFLQNHDQVGNRPRGERIGQLARPDAIRAAMALLLLQPSVPLLFMGQEWGAREPFPYFCDFEPQLAAEVARGRRREFAGFVAFGETQLPDPGDERLFRSAILDWRQLSRRDGQAWLHFTRELLWLRRKAIVPRLSGPGHLRGAYRQLSDAGLAAWWPLRDGSTLRLVANLCDRPLAPSVRPEGDLLYTTHKEASRPGARQWPPWSLAWHLDRGSMPPLSQGPVL